MEPTYIDRMEKFLEEQLNELTPLEAVLYLNLFHIRNKARLENGKQMPEWFTVKNNKLSDTMGKEAKGIRRLKQSLKAKGLIDYQQGKKGTPTKYRLLDGEEKEVKIRGEKLPQKQEKGAKLPPYNDPQNVPLFEAQTLTAQGLADPLREEENSIYPHTPKGGGSDLFQTFYKSYPKKKGKQAAERAFLKLKPDTDLFRQIMAALEAQKKSPDWQKEAGQYIPYPATWLKGRRWEDEIEVNQPSHENIIEQRDAERRAQAAADEAYLKGADANGET